ncbi:MAG: cysteine peroxiredoxin [Piptocephalis tieghemiana]|nr:MAG: cysteine peroxiredoxin [Piptocephalis tieghemiana]
MSTLRLGSIVPDFEAVTTKGPIKFHEWIGSSWAILFSHPADFTPVCTTELGAVAKVSGSFADRDVKIIGLSVDDVKDHESWISDINEVNADVNEVNDVTVSFPVIADHDRKISVAYGMLDDPTHDPTNIAPSGDPMTVRSVFFIDPSLRIRATLTYPATCGRNFGEILRVLDSLQLTDSRRVTTPANWFPGDPVIIHPGVSNEEADKLFPGYKTIKPYLRTTRL